MFQIVWKVYLFYPSLEAKWKSSTIYEREAERDSVVFILPLNILKNLVKNILEIEEFWVCIRQGTILLLVS